jgi:diguanylate cyclase
MLTVTITGGGYMIRSVLSDRRVLAAWLLLASALILALSNASAPWLIAVHGLMAVLVASSILMDPTRRGSWNLIAGAVGLWALAQFARLAAEEITPVVAIIAVIVIILAVVGYVGVHIKPDRHQLPWIIVDSVVFSIALASIQWFFILEDALAPSNSFLNLNVTILASVFSVVAVIPTSMMLAYLVHFSHARLSGSLLAIGLAALSLFAGAWAQVRLSTFFFDVVAAAGLIFLLMGLLLLSPSPAKVRPQESALTLSAPSWWQLLPTLIGASALGLALVHSAVSRWHFTDIIVTLTVGAAIVIRQFLFFNEERRLFRLVVDQHQQLRHQAMHDPLTNVANRDLFYDRLNLALLLRQRSPSPLSVIYFNISGFKRVNTEFGHGTGDSVLVAVADRLATWVRPTDTVGRLGADEFAIIVDGSENSALVVAERLAEEVDRGFEISGRMISVRLNIGIATSDDFSGDGQDLALDLVNRADRAMHEARRESSSISVIRVTTRR